jgi:hypothetical protein
VMPRRRVCYGWNLRSAVSRICDCLAGRIRRKL